jgi:4-hydroxy-2-oxoheptanedioate aldolase
MNVLLRYLKDTPLTWAINLGGPSIDVLDMLAAAGVKCVFIDCERTPVGIESVGALVRAATSHGMFTMLRSESKQPEILIRYLDRGIDGIVVPHTENAKELEEISQVLAYVSKGKSDQFMSIAQIESVKAIENIEEMTSSQAVDSFLVGPNDLSHSLGLKGDLTPDILWQNVNRAIAHLQKNQRVWGILGNPGQQDKWQTQGAKFLYSTTHQIIQAGFQTYK